MDGKVLLFLSPPEGDTGADTDSHTGQTDREEYPPHAVRRSRFGRLGSGFRGGLGRGGGGRGGACLNFRNGDRFRLGAAADRADALLLAFLAFRRLLRDGPVSKGMRAGFREELAAAGIFLRVLRLGDGPFRHAAVYVVRAVDIAVSLAADLALCPPEAGRRAAGMFPRGGDRRAGTQQSIAVLAVGIAGIARCRAGGRHRAADLFVAGVVVGVNAAPLVFIRLRSLVVAGATVLVVHRLRDAGGRRLKVHIARHERMQCHECFPFGAIEALKPVGFGVSSYLRVGAPLPALGKSVLGMVVLSAANGALALHATVHSAVAPAFSRFNLAAARALAGAGVGVVFVGLPLAPDVAELAVFSAAQRAGFARGAGGRFGAASMFKYTTIISRTARALLFIPASYTFNSCPMEHWVRRTADRGGNEPYDLKIFKRSASVAPGTNHRR